MQTRSRNQTTTVKGVVEKEPAVEKAPLADKPTPVEKAPPRRERNPPKKVKDPPKKEKGTKKDKEREQPKKAAAAAQAAREELPSDKPEQPEAPEEPVEVGDRATPQEEPQNEQPEQEALSEERAHDKTVIYSTSSDSGNIDFSKFRLEKVINDSVDLKSITLQGLYADQQAVLVLEKTPFEESSAKEALNDKTLVASLDFFNDRYHSYMIKSINPARSLSDLKTTFIWPATDDVLKKYTRAEVVFFPETPEVYSKVVEPYIERITTMEVNPAQWVYNILEGKSEKERVIFNDPNPDSGFMLTKNLKAMDDDKDLYLLAICHRRDIRSLRDLNDEHLVLLKNILIKGTKAIKDKFKKHKGHMRLFVHYQPTFYHFHVHFKAVDPGSYSSSDRDHLLTTVISNLTLNKDYYKKSTITYPLEKTSALFQDLKKAKKV